MTSLSPSVAWKKIGVDLVNAVRDTYALWQATPSERTRKKYMTWRLRIHLNSNHQRELLELVNEEYNLGLNDPEPGKLFWDITEG